MYSNDFKYVVIKSKIKSMHRMAFMLVEAVNDSYKLWLFLKC